LYYTSKKIFSHVLFIIYFMEDIILLNIYNTINLDIKSFEYITFEGFYYEKSDLI